MDKNIKLFKKEDADLIIAEGLNDKLMEIDASFEDNRICNYSKPGQAFTYFLNGKPVFACGIVQLWDGVAEAWVLAGKNVFDIKILAAKTIKQLQDQTCKKYKIKRLQTSVKANFERGLRFATWCGFEVEGLKRKYGPDGTDYYQLGIIY
jgi:RimJ/RimL family protein N-acetyltransferase